MKDGRTRDKTVTLKRHLKRCCISRSWALYVFLFDFAVPAGFQKEKESFPVCFAILLGTKCTYVRRRVRVHSYIYIYIYSMHVTSCVHVPVQSNLDITFTGITKFAM